MERLTEQAPGCFEYRLKDHKSEPGEFGNYDAFFDYSMAVNRLGQYEDTGLEPEEIERILDAYGRGHTLRTESAERLEIMREVKTDRLREIIRADQEGRLVVLPCGTDAESDVIDDPEWKERMMQKFVGRR